MAQNDTNECRKADPVLDFRTQIESLRLHRINRRSASSGCPNSRQNFAQSSWESLINSEKSEIVSGMSDELDVLIRAMANVTRRQILSMVWEECLSAGAVAEAIDLAPASVSEHLKVLRKAELVFVEKSGTSWNYRANHAAVQALIRLLKREFPRPKK